jgi:hypothetical protein
MANTHFRVPFQKKLKTQVKNQKTREISTQLIQVLNLLTE